MRETCEIAMAKVEWDHSEDLKRDKDILPAQPLSLSLQPSHPSVRCLIDFTFFRTCTSFDPTPRTSGFLAGRAGTATVSSIEEMRSKPLCTQLPLLERYRPMSALWNAGSPPAVDALAEGFSGGSALFK